MSFTEHNDWLKSRGYPASPNSFHKIGNDKWGTDTCAVDIAIPNSVFRKDLVKRAIDLGWSVGVARTFIHVDRRSRLYTTTTSCLCLLKLTKHYGSSLQILFGFLMGVFIFTILYFIGDYFNGS